MLTLLIGFCNRSADSISEIMFPKKDSRFTNENFKPIEPIVT